MDANFASRLVNKHRTILLKELDVSLILPSLVHQGVFSKAEQTEIRGGKTSTECKELFLRLLSQKSAGVFKTFCSSLEKHYPHILTEFVVERSESEQTASADTDTNSEALHLSYRFALKERDESLRQYAVAKKQLEEIQKTQTQAMHHDDPYGGRHPQQFVRGRPTGGMGTPNNERSSFFRKKNRKQGRGSNLSRSESQLMWETLVVKINRVDGLGFGIAVSGGRDNPHYMTEEDAIVISDVLANGPAEHLVKVNDRVLAVNNQTMEGVEHDEAIMALRDSGNTVVLHIKRPIGDGVTGADGGQSNVQSIELFKEGRGYGMKLAIKLYIEDMNPDGSAAKSGLTSGDNIVAINGVSIEALSLPDAKKIIQNSRGSLFLDIKKEPKKRVDEKPPSPAKPTPEPKKKDINGLPDPHLMSPPPPDMYNPEPEIDNHSIEDLTLPSPPDDSVTFEDNDDVSSPPRPPLPESNPELPMSNDDGDSYLPAEPSFSQPLMSTPPPPDYEDERPATNNKRGNQTSYDAPPVTPGSEERHVSFIKGKSIGLQLVGGNSTGIFVAAMQPGSAAEKAGVHEGDQILQVNDSSLLGMTKEDAVLMLLSLTNEIRLVCRYDKRMCDEVMKSGKGDDFYVRTHFNYESQGPEEMTFFKNNIFRVIDTMYEGMVGWWYALKIGVDEREEGRGIIPNNSRAEQLAMSQPPDYYMKPQPTGGGRSSFFKRRQKSFRSTKNLIKDQWDKVVFGGTPPKFPPYERVALKDPEFVRPVVIFGPLADIARDKLLAEFNEKFESPYNQGDEEAQGTIKVHAIREIMGKGKHCILDITPNAVERLNFAQFYPIVIFLRPDNRTTVKQLRGKHLEPEQNRGSRKLTQTAKNLNKVFVHIFSATVRLGPDAPWFSQTRDAILREQNKPIWISDVSVPKEEQEPELPVVGELTLPSDYESDAESAFSGAESTYNDSMVESDYEAEKASPKLVRDTYRPSNDYTLPNSFTDDYRSPREPRSKHKSKPYSPDTDEEYGGDLSDGSTGYVPQNKPSPNRRRPNEASRRRKEEREREEREREEREREEQDRRDRDELERRERERQERDIQNKKKREQLEKERERERELIKEIERQQEERRREAEIKMSKSAPSFDEPTIMDPVSITQSYSQPSYSSPSLNARTFDVHVDMPAPPIDSPVSTNYSLPPKPAPKPRYDPTQFTSSTLMDYSKPEVKPRPSKLTTESRDLPELVKVEAVVHPSKAQAVHTSFAQPAQASMETTFGVDDDYIQPTNAPEERSSYWQPAMETDLDSYVTATPAETTFDVNDEPSYNGMNGSSYKSDNNNKYGSSKPEPASPYYDPKMEPVNSGISFNREKDHRIQSYDRLKQGPFHHDSSSRGRAPKGEFEGFDRVLNAKAPYEKQSYKEYREQTRGRDQSPGSSYLRSSLYTPAAWGSSRQGSNDHLRTEHTFKSVKAPQGKGSQDNLDMADNGETPVDQMDGQTVLATAKGMFDHRGGTLMSEETGVSIVIPEGALPYGVKQEIYFKVCRDNSMLPPLDSYKGETLLSPLVMCGPHNLKFNKPVELRLPHQTSMTPDGWSFNLKSSDTPAGQPAKWKNLKIDDEERSQRTVVGTKTVSVMVDHF